MKEFYLKRNQDVSGVSGTGIVAEGVIWDNGQVTMKWLGDRGAINTYPDIEAVEEIHGHQGSTVVVYEHEKSNILQTQGS